MVSRHLVRSGALDDSFLVDGRWRLAGVSPTGTYVALSRRSADRSRTWIQIRGASGTRVHSLELRGDFEVETVSRDGERLFLIEHLRGDGSPRYLVRLFDLARDRLASAPLRGQGEPRVMAGLAWSGIGSPDGRWLLTLYLNTARSVAFVHALDLVRSSPLCIFLPTGDSFGELKSYGLTLSPDGKKLYAANAELGAVAEIDLATRKVVRTVRFAGTEVPAAAPLSMTRHHLAHRTHALLQRRPRPLRVRRGVRRRARPVPHGRRDPGLWLRRGRQTRPRAARRRPPAHLRRGDRASESGDGNLSSGRRCRGATLAKEDR